jgi:DNA-binding CsgD family transcriptional regulator
MRDGEGWLEIVEAIYRLNDSEERWLSGILEAARPVLDRGLGGYAATYDATQPAVVRYKTFVAFGDNDPETMKAALTALTESDSQKSMNLTICGTASELLGDSFADFEPLQSYGRSMGVADSLGINAIEPGGTGCVLVSLLPRVSRASRREKDLWGRITAHMLAALRLRGRLLGGKQADELPGEAVLTPSGTLEHAVGPATERGAAEALRAAVQAVEQARGALGQAEPEKAIFGWRSLVSARWSLLDRAPTGGARQLVAVQNELTAPGPASLTDRERQVLALAALGRTNALIAYELGIPDSTVTILLRKAGSKLDIHSRDELIRRFLARAL